METRAVLLIRRMVGGVAAVLALALVCSCAHRPPVEAVDDSVPLDQRLASVAALHNRGQVEALRAYFAKGVRIQLPATPQGADFSHYMTAWQANPYSISFSGMEMVYSSAGRAATRATLSASAPGRFSVKERVMIDWVAEDGYWKISRIAVADWPSIIGTWRRSGARGEGSIELQILPGGNYVVYLAEDYSMPAFRGNYVLEGNKITFTDFSANDAKLFSGGAGSYMYVRTPSGVTFRKVEDDNPWRTERYDGDWSGGR